MSGDGVRRWPEGMLCILRHAGIGVGEKNPAGLLNCPRISDGAAVFAVTSIILKPDQFAAVVDEAAIRLGSPVRLVPLGARGAKRARPCRPDGTLLPGRKREATPRFVRRLFHVIAPIATLDSRIGCCRCVVPGQTQIGAPADGGIRNGHREKYANSKKNQPIPGHGGARIGAEDFGLIGAPRPVRLRTLH